MLDQILSRGAVGLDRSGRRDVIGRDAVAQQREDAHAAEIARHRRRHRHPLEERRLADVGRIGPGILVAFRHRQLLPPLVALEDVTVAALEHLRVHRVLHRFRFGDRFGLGLDPKPGLAAQCIANVPHASSP